MGFRVPQRAKELQLTNLIWLSKVSYNSYLIAIVCPKYTEDL